MGVGDLAWEVDVGDAARDTRVRLRGAMGAVTQ